jgi:2TM domain
MSRPQPHAGDGEIRALQIAHREDLIMSSDVPLPRPEPEPPHVRAEAQRWVRRLRVLYTILGIYAVLSLMWFAIDMADGTESLWFYWPMLGTGLAVAVTAIVLVGIGGLFGADWETRKGERYLRQHPGRNDTGFQAPPSPSTRRPNKNDRTEARP